MKIDARGAEWIDDLLDPMVYFGKVQWHEGWKADVFDTKLPFITEGETNTEYNLIKGEICDIAFAPTIGCMVFIPQMCEGTIFFVIPQEEVAGWIIETAVAREQLGKEPNHGLTWIYELDEPELVEVV